MTIFTENIIVMSDTKIKIGDPVEFTEDEWCTVYKGTVKDETTYSYYIESRRYGNFYIAKNNVRLLDKHSS